MGASARCGGAAPNDPSVLDDDTANCGIGPDLPQSPRAKAQRQCHVADVRLCAHSPSGWGGRSSLTNSSKSSAAWKFL